MQIRKLYNVTPLIGAAILLAGFASATLYTPALYAQSASKIINADAFYNRAIKLQRLGVRAPFNDDFKPMVAHARKSFRSVEAQNKSAKRRGKPLYCRPEDKQLSPSQVVRELSRIPRITRKKINLNRAFLMIAKRKYPC